MVKALTLKEQKEIMEMEGTFPCRSSTIRKDCEVCLRAAGADRHRKRLQCPTSFCLSMDIMGPFVQGKDQELKGPRYGLVATYTVPIDKHGAPLPQGLAGPHLPHQQGRDVEDERRWRDFLQDRKSQNVKNLTFAVPLKSRHNDDLLQAVAQIYVKTKTMALPVQRVHTDRAKEFVGEGFQKWIKDHDLFHTMSSGSEPQGNARVEREVRELKQRMRTVLTASRAPTHFWPLALRHVGEQRRRRQLQALGVTTPELLPFGMKAMAKQKLWQKGDNTLKYPMQKVRLWGPAADMATTSLGYYVQSDETGKFFRSTVVKVFADQPYKLDVVMHHGGRKKDLEANFNWMTLEMKKIADWMTISKVHNNLKKHNKLKQLTIFKLEMMKFKKVSSTMRSKNPYNKNVGGSTSPTPKEDCRSIRAWRSTRCWKRLTKEDRPWELRNQHHRNRQSGGDYMVKDLKCDLITPGSSRSMQQVQIKFDFLGMKNIVEHNAKKQSSA